MAAIDKTRTDPPDKVEMGGGAAFSSPAANRKTPLTAYQQQQKDSGGGGSGSSSSGKLKAGEPAGLLSSSASKKSQQHNNPSSTTTTTFQLEDSNRHLPNSRIPHFGKETKQKPRQHQQQRHHHQQKHDLHQDRMKDDVTNIHDDIKIVVPHQNIKDWNSNTNHHFSPPGTVEPSENPHLNANSVIKTNQQHGHHEPEKLVNYSRHDPKEYKDNSFSWDHQPSYRDNENSKNGNSYDINPPASIHNSNPNRNTTIDNRKPRNIDEVSLTSSSGTVLSGLDRDPKLPFPRSSSPRLVRRQDHVEVPCDDVAIIDIENEEDTKIKSSDDTEQPASLSNRDSGIKSSFYIGDGDGTPTFEDDISRINSVVNSDIEVTESSLVLPEVFSTATCPTSGESSIRSSLTEPQLGSTGQRVTYRKQKKGNKKKKSNGTTGDQTDEENRGSGKSSNWRRLRNTLKAANEMKSPKKQNHPLTREDSFLRKFSTRNHNNVQNSSTLSDEESPTDKVPNIPTWTKLVIQHDGNFMFYWLGVVTLSVMYNLWTCIAREGFEEIQTGCTVCWYFLDGVFDVIYVLDIVVQFRTGYLDQGLMVYDSKKLRQRYFASKIIYVDFICLLPLDFVQILVGIHPMLRFPRFLKIYRAFRFLHMLESRTAYPNFIRVVSLTHVLFLGAHWFAAFYYMISEAEGFQGNWAYPKPTGSYADVRRKYLKSLYWSTLTLTTIGDLPQPENANEYVFVIVSYLIGVFVFATIVGQVGNVINNRNASRQEFERLLDGAKVYMQTHNVPQNLQKRVQRWYDYVWSRGRLNNGDINSLGLLPDKLKTELAIHVNLETLKKVTIFQECQPEFLHDLVLKMKAYIFTPGDLICRRGEVAREMFIIADGLVEIISETGTILKRMGAGDFFGEIGILNLDGGINRRSADVRSVGYLELFVLSRDDILGAMKDHPEAESIIRDYGQRRLREVEAHRQRVKPLKGQDSTLDAPTGGQNVQNRLLMTLRSLSPAVRRQSSQLAHTGRQSSLQNPPNPPGSPVANSKRCVTQRSSDSHGSSPSVKSSFDHTTTVRKTMSDFNYSSVESFREHLASKQHSGSYCEACGSGYYHEDSFMSVRGGGNRPRRYVSTVYSKIGNLFRKRMGGRRTRSVVYDTPPGMFRNSIWQRGGPGETGRLSLQQLKHNYCQNCHVNLKFDSSEDHDKSFNSNNNALSEHRASTDSVHCEANHTNNEDCDNLKQDTVQICDESGGAGDTAPSFGSKIARVIQSKMGWAGNVSYTPVSQGDNADDDKGGDKSHSLKDLDRNQSCLDRRDDSDQFVGNSHSLCKDRRAYLRDRTQSLGNDADSKPSNTLSDTNQSSCLRFTPHSTGCLERPLADGIHTGITGTNREVAQQEMSNSTQISPISNNDAPLECIQSFRDVSRRASRVPSQSHPDLTTDTSGQCQAKATPQRRSTTSTISPSVLQYSPTDSSSLCPAPLYLLPDKCTVTPHPTFADDLLQTNSHSQHQLRNSEFSSILHSTSPLNVPQSRFSLDHSSEDPLGKSINHDVNETVPRSVTWYSSDPRSDPPGCSDTKYSSRNVESHERGHLWDDAGSKGQSQTPKQLHRQTSGTNNHHNVRNNSETTQIRKMVKRRCKSCGGGGGRDGNSVGGQKRRKGLAIFMPRRTCSIPDLLGDASFLLSLKMRQGSSCRSDSMSRDGSGKKGRSKALSIMQTPTQDMAFQHLAEQISSMQEMIDARLASIEESHASTTHRLDRLATSHELLVRMFKKMTQESGTARLDTPCEEVDSLHSSCV